MNAFVIYYITTISSKNKNNLNKIINIVIILKICILDLNILSTLATFSYTIAFIDKNVFIINIYYNIVIYFR